MTTLALNTPVLEREASRVGHGLWRKQLLPKGSITYQGSRVDFDDAYLRQLAASFDERAFDHVGVVLADEQNRHTMDPSRLRGSVRSLEVTTDGLDMLVDLAPEAEAIVAANPNLGVSARLLHDSVRTDGQTEKVFPAALQHVLLTTQPVVAGMKPWQHVELSQPNAVPVIDLSSRSWTEEGITTMPPITATPADPMTALAALLSPEQRTALQALLTDTPAEPAGDPIEGVLAKLTAGAQLTAEESAAFAAWAQTDDPAVPPAATAPVPAVPAAAQPAATVPAPAVPQVVPTAAAPVPAAVGLAAPASAAPQSLELAHALAQISELQVQNARVAWTGERDLYARAGVPPVVLDLAAPVMVAPTSSTVELSGGHQADVKTVLRKVFDALKGTVELSIETGSSHAGSSLGKPATVETARESDIYKAWAAQSTHL